MKHPQLSGIATALAKQGRHGDDTLIHVSRKELETLQKYGDELGIHLTVNPQTGLPEAFNWGGMAGSVGLPLLVLAATAATGGVAAPWMLAAAGAAGGAGGTLAGGGSTEQALMSGVMGGIGGWGMGGIAEGLSAAGTAATEEAAKQAVEQTATNTLADTSTQALSSSAPGIWSQGIQSGAQQGVTDAAGQTGLQQVMQGASQNSGILNNLTQQSGQQILGEGSSQAAGSVVNGAFVPTPPASPVLQSVPQAQSTLMGKGLEAVTASPSALGNFAMGQAKNIGMTGIGALGAGASLNPQEQTIQTEPDTSNPYQGEMYMDPATGQWRSRAVRKADGGEVFSDYDAADVQKDGGYAPGGYLNLASGGEAGLASIGKGVPSVEDPYAEYPDYWLEARELGPTRRQDGLAAGGGIGDLGSYSDGGRLLRGPGDGVSDNIPATIENKRPARLADGEFVIPARAVSELGNGSTEAGSKQLYKMLDRIAQKRKSGKGLAYEASPKKLMPA